MINVRETRFWTALAVIGLSAMTISFASSTLQFALAAREANSDNAREKLAPSTSEWPAGALAQDLAMGMAPARAPADRVVALENLLSWTPMASGRWIQLARARREAGAPMGSVASALVVSTLTGPNEAFVMARRAEFGLANWDQLPPDVRRTLVGDLIGGWSEIGDDSRRNLAAILALAPDQTRAEISAGLLLAGKKAEAITIALDLVPEKLPASGASLPLDVPTERPAAPAAEGAPAASAPPASSGADLAPVGEPAQNK